MGNPIKKYRKNRGMQICKVFIPGSSQGSEDLRVAFALVPQPNDQGVAFPFRFRHGYLSLRVAENRDFGK